MRRHLKIVEPEKPQQMPKVVVVEEDPTYLHMWERVFSSIGNCRYCITNDPKMVQSMAREHPVDLLISEVVLEKLTGFDLAKAVHEGNPNANVVLTSTYDCDLSRFNLDHPKFHILHKPYQSIEDVVEFLKQILGHNDPRKIMDEDSYSESIDFPTVTEWKL